MAATGTNRLGDAISPYLLQHASQPVPWQPWDDVALAEAARRDVPLFVSIGYAACHWCHVMAHESFDDPEVARLLAEGFVAIKVDREERPDLDAVYMAAATTMTGNGGWPLSVFCTPDGRPFFAGTYYPRDDRHGMPGFLRVLGAISESWHERRPLVESQADELTAAVAADSSLPDRLGVDGDHLDIAEVVARGVAELASRFDPRWGGFGGAPKFPRPAYIDLCLREYLSSGSNGALSMATTTLGAMARGGIYDHLAGGFARYSTDGQWLVPHFEKMLSDQALLARSYLQAWLVTGRPEYAQVVTETLDYVLCELELPTGGLASSEDADAAGVEGSHAVFTVPEVGEALSVAGARVGLDEVCAWYGITESGNFEGANILHRGLDTTLERPSGIEEARLALLAARKRRPQPGLDDKVLAEWNAMAVVALAQAAFAMGSDAWRDGAVRILGHLLDQLRDDSGRLLRCKGTATRAFLADLAWTIDACLAVATVTGQRSWIAAAADCGDELLAHHQMQNGGGLPTVPDDGAALVVRAIDWLDGAVPAANSIAARALARLGAVSGEARFTRSAEAILEAAAGLLTLHPAAVPDLLAAQAMVESGVEVVIVGDHPELLDVLRRRWLPDAVVVWGEPFDGGLWDGRADGLAYVCRQMACLAPAPDAATLEAQLNQW